MKIPTIVKTFVKAIVWTISGGMVFIWCVDYFGIWLAIPWTVLYWISTKFRED